MNTSGLNMFLYDEAPQQLMPEPTRPPPSFREPSQYAHPARQLHRAATVQDPSVVSPVFFGYDVPQQPHYQQQPPPHYQRPSARPMPASMGFSAQAMPQERQLQQNPAISYYQAFQAGSSLDGIDAGLFGNYDINMDNQPQPSRVMYMSDMHGQNEIVHEQPSSNQAYRLYKS